MSERRDSEGRVPGRRWRSAGTAGTVALALLIAPAAVTAATLYVDAAWTGTTPGDDPDGAGPATNFGTDSFATINSAIAAAAATDTIEVAAGTYAENVVVNKALDLRGANHNTACGARGAESVIAPASGLPVSVTSGTDGVSLNGFEITAPAYRNAIVCGGTSDLTIAFNNIHDINSSGSPSLAVTHAIQYTVPNSVADSNVNIVDNCFQDIASANLTGNSASAIGILQSTTTGTLTDLTIARNSIDNVQVNQGVWPTGKIAYGIQLNVAGGGSYLTSTGKIVDAVIEDNTISNLGGHIATGIALEGNTENAQVTGNTVSNLSATKAADRSGGGYDLNGLKFENNRYVGTCTVTLNSFATDTFTHTSGAGLGYAIANYVATGQAYEATTTSEALVTCNWLGTAVKGEIEDNDDLDGRILNKAGAATTFVPFLADNNIVSPSCWGGYPVQNVDSGIAYETIGAAITAATAGDTITVEAGTYAENVVINKELDLRGANYNTACGARGAESVIAPASGLPVQVTSGTDGVSLNGFEITAPTYQYAISCGGTSDLTVAFNNIHDVNSSGASLNANTHAIVYQLPNAAADANVNIVDNCITNVGKATQTNYSVAAIGVLQSVTTGTLSDLTIARNSIDTVQMSQATWPTGKLAYGIILNIGGGSSYLSTTGKIVDAVIEDNSITNLSGHIATGIGLEGNTENAVVKGNSVSNLSATKAADRSGGGYDLNGLKFENNRYVSTVWVENNHLAAETFTHTSGAGLGYAVANYVPTGGAYTGGTTGAANLQCNWLGSAVQSEIEDNVDLDGRILNKAGAATNLLSFLTSDSDTDGGTAGFQPSIAACVDGPPLWIISTLLEGDISDNPKGVEIKNVSGAPIDLSVNNVQLLVYNEARDTSLGPNAVNDLNALTGGATIPAGGFVFVYNDTTSLSEAYPNLGSTSGLTAVDGDVNIDGDDTVVVSTTTGLNGRIDYYGEFDAGFTTSVDGTGTGWEYTNAGGVRTDNGTTKHGATAASGGKGKLPNKAGAAFNLVALPSSGTYEPTLPLAQNSFVPVELDSFVID